MFILHPRQTELELMDTFMFKNYCLCYYWPMQLLCANERNHFFKILWSTLQENCHYICTYITSYIIHHIYITYTMWMTPFSTVQCIMSLTIFSRSLPLSSSSLWFLLQFPLANKSSSWTDLPECYMRLWFPVSLKHILLYLAYKFISLMESRTYSFNLIQSL